MHIAQVNAELCQQFRIHTVAKQPFYEKHISTNFWNQSSAELCFWTNTDTCVPSYIPGQTGAGGRGAEEATSAVRVRVALHLLSVQRQAAERPDQAVPEGHQAAAGGHPGPVSGELRVGFR